jgi:hypothetical protein
MSTTPFLEDAENLGDGVVMMVPENLLACS